MERAVSSPVARHEVSRRRLLQEFGAFQRRRSSARCYFHFRFLVAGKEPLISEKRSSAFGGGEGRTEEDLLALKILNADCSGWGGKGQRSPLWVNLGMGVIKAIQAQNWVKNLKPIL